jgi:hypothetical protein
LRYFDDFLRSQDKISEFGNSNEADEENLCNVELWQQFATYNCDIAEKKILQFL